MPFHFDRFISYLSHADVVFSYKQIARRINSVQLQASTALLGPLGEARAGLDTVNARHLQSALLILLVPALSALEAGLPVICRVHGASGAGVGAAFGAGCRAAGRAGGVLGRGVRGNLRRRRGGAGVRLVGGGGVVDAEAGSHCEGKSRSGG